MNLEGRITITLAPSTGKHCNISINSSRPVHASRLFEGKSVDETLKALPLLFSVCSTAQAAAAVRACEQALDLPGNPATEQAREQLVMLEAIREHLWQPLFHWNQLLDQTTDETTMAAVMAIQQQGRQQCAAESLFQPTATTTSTDFSIPQQQLRTLLEQQLFDCDLEQWLQLDTVDALLQWSQTHTTIAARFIQQLQQRAWNALGQCAITPLPPLDYTLLEQALQDEHFIQQPTWKGATCESSVLTRNDSPLLQQLHQHYGNGLLTRSVARLNEIATLTLQLNHPHLPRSAAAKTGSVGIGTAHAARGLLLHRVAISQQQISRYQILAPTEWNFHPEGIVARALNTLTCDAIDLEQQAHQLIHAIDPCVGYDLIISH